MCNSILLNKLNCLLILKHPLFKDINFYKFFICVFSKDPGACFACDLSRQSCGSYYASSERSSVCVESTAYTLLALLTSGDIDNTVCLSNWLVKIRNGAGGYYSSQVSD